MLDIKYIREHKEQIIQNCQHRGVSCDVDALLDCDVKRRQLIFEIEALRAKKKKQSKAKPSQEEIQALRHAASELKDLEKQLKEQEETYQHLMYRIPNLTHPESPLGSEEDSKVIFSEKSPPEFSFKPKDHDVLLKDLGWVDFERGAKVSGSKFYFSKGLLVRLNQALLNYGMDVVSKYGYQLMETPDIARNEILEGIGFNPRGEETQVYSIENTDLSLIGTAEITLGGYHANEVMDLSQGPMRYAALSHCFRTEAGAYGKESRGMYRVHQFTKLEMFVYCEPKDSEKMHAEILDIEKEICNNLGFPYRVLDIATGDLGGPAYRKFDIEAWMTHRRKEAEKGGYGEITSCSNCTDYQARRLNIRYRKQDGKLDFVHTLNGTALVSSRFPIAIVECFQKEDGQITIPDVLKPYMGR